MALSSPRTVRQIGRTLVDFFVCNSVWLLILSLCAMGCPTRVGYALRSSQDHPGNDLLPEPVVAPEIECNRDIDCVGFVTSKADGSIGLLKTATSPASFNSSSCLYTKQPTRCPKVVSYSRLVDYSLSEPSYLAPLTPSPAAWCAARENCSGYVTSLADGPRGFPLAFTLDSTRGIQPVYSFRSCLYTKQDIACPSRAGYTVRADASHRGDDTSILVVDPMALCEADAGCAGFGMYSASGQGMTKARVERVQDAPGLCLYAAKRPSSCPNQPGYTVHPGRDHPGDNLREGSLVPNPREACSNNTACAGYTVLRADGRGVLKAVVSLRGQPATGVCLYIKNG